MQLDGNFVLYQSMDWWPENAFWASNTDERRVEHRRIVMQNDGNLVMYDSLNKQIWASDTNGSGTQPYSLVMQRDRNLVIYDGNGQATWATGTNIWRAASLISIKISLNIIIKNHFKILYLQYCLRKPSWNLNTIISRKPLTVKTIVLQKVNTYDSYFYVPQESNILCHILALFSISEQTNCLIIFRKMINRSSWLLRCSWKEILLAKCWKTQRKFIGNWFVKRSIADGSATFNLFKWMSSSYFGFRLIRRRSILLIKLLCNLLLFQFWKHQTNC